MIAGFLFAIGALAALAAIGATVFVVTLLISLARDQFAIWEERGQRRELERLEELRKIRERDL